MWDAVRVGVRCLPDAFDLLAFLRGGGMLDLGHVAVAAGGRQDAQAERLILAFKAGDSGGLRFAIAAPVGSEEQQVGETAMMVLLDLGVAMLQPGSK